MSNKIKIIFLGNSASAPTSTRNLTSVLLNYNGENYLFDCPENTQQQVMKAKQSLMKINNIFISHLHGDHYFGLFGLLSSFKLSNRTLPLTIFVPTGSKKTLDSLIQQTIDNKTLDYKITIKETNAGKILDTTEIQVNAIALDHSIKTNGYIFKIKDKIGRFNKEKAKKLKIPEGPLYSKLQKGKSIKLDGKTITPSQVIDYKYKKTGKKIAYLCDTAVLKKIPQILEDADILIHEATFFKEDEKKAKLVKHSVAEEVLIFAKKIKAKNTYLTHISSKYQDLEERESILQKQNKNQKINIIKDLENIEIEDY